MATYGIPTGTDNVVLSVRSQNIKELGKICKSLDTMEETGLDMTRKQMDDQTRGWVDKAEDVLADGGESVVIDGVVAETFSRSGKARKA